LAAGYDDGMSTPFDPIAAETHELYLHLLNLKQATGEAATDPVALHRDIANAPERKEAHVDPTALQDFYAGTAFADAAHLAAIRTVLDRAHHHAVDPRFWRPHWLKTRQGVQYAHPRIPNHKLHHQSVG
jgi:hypothetical protein